MPPRTIGPTARPRNSKLVTAAEVAAASAQRPEEVGVLVGGGPHDAAVGQHDLGCQQRVDREAVVAHQPADAAAERQAADAGVRDLARRHGQAVLLRGRVDLARAARRRRRARVAVSGIDLDAAERAQVDQQRAVADASARTRSARRRGS